MSLSVIHAAARVDRRVALRPVVEFAQPSERAEQRRLARAVGAGQTPALAGSDHEIEPVDEHALTGAQRQGVGLQQRGTHRITRRESNQRNTGTPIIAVMTPTGNCVGASTVRAMRSASMRSAPPASAAAGSSMRWSLPKR